MRSAGPALLCVSLTEPQSNRTIVIKEERERGDGGRERKQGGEREREKEKQSYKKKTSLCFLNRAGLVQGLVAKIMEEQPQEKQEHGSILGVKE